MDNEKVASKPHAGASGEPDPDAGGLDYARILYALSHDLKEPLRKVSNYTALLVRSLPDLDDKQRVWADTALDGALRMHDMIESLLFLSRIGRLERPMSLQATNDVVDAVWANSDARREADVLDRDDLPDVWAEPQQFFAA